MSEDSTFSLKRFLVGKPIVYAIPISLVIATLLAIVAFSYRQTIHAYPTGGGAYIVAKKNIGSIGGGRKSPGGRPAP